jgi:hypothetical protein
VIADDFIELGEALNIFTSYDKLNFIVSERVSQNSSSRKYFFLILAALRNMLTKYLALNPFHALWIEITLSTSISSRLIFYRFSFLAQRF